MVAGIVYFLIADQNFTTPSTSNELYSKKSTFSNEPNAINFLNNYSSINRNNRPFEVNRQNQTNEPSPSSPPPLKVLSTNHANQNIWLVNVNARPPFTAPTAATSPTKATASTTQKTPLASTSPSPSNIFVRSTTAKTISAETPSAKFIAPISTVRPTYENSARDTAKLNNIKVYTNSNARRKLPQPAPKHTTLLLPTGDDLEENVVERSKLLFPSKETFENFGFTSGHQNSFGIPIEEDERILRMLNYQMISSQPKESKQNQNDDFLLLSITTDANIHQTRVSPTLPNIKKYATSTERIRALNVTTDDGNL